LEKENYERNNFYLDYNITIVLNNEYVYIWLNKRGCNNCFFNSSKRASHALRLYNPDIPDLSDTNRPTKIAEKFSELYDNEWIEAFESLSKTERSSEKANIETLLNIVTVTTYSD
jgi:hypothetical protein